jgi:hypothetical protein
VFTKNTAPHFLGITSRPMAGNDVPPPDSTVFKYRMKVPSLWPPVPIYLRRAGALGAVCAGRGNE